jgi:hypothetical protein
VRQLRAVIPGQNAPLRQQATCRDTPTRTVNPSAKADPGSNPRPATHVRRGMTWYVAALALEFSRAKGLVPALGAGKTFVGVC